MQKLWFIILSMSAVALPLNARILIDAEQMQVCIEIDSAADRLDCYDGAVINAPETAFQPQVAEPQPQAQPVVTEGLASWSQNPNLPNATRLAAAVLMSNERTAIGGFPIAIVNSETNEILTPPQSPLERFLRELSDDTVAATRYSRDFYFSIPSQNTSTESAILGFSCQRNITNMHIHFSTPFPDTMSEVGFYLNRRDVGGLDEITSNQRFIDNGFVMEAPRGLVGIDLIRRLMAGDEVEVRLKRNGEDVIVNFNVQDLDQPMSILARQCSWQV